MEDEEVIWSGSIFEVDAREAMERDDRLGGGGRRSGGVGGVGRGGGED